MRVELEKLGKNGTGFEHVYQLGELVFDEDAIRLTLPAEVNGSVKPDGRHVRVQGAVRTQVEVECDRCLQPIAVTVDAEFNVSYVPANVYAEDETPELNEDDLNMSVFDEDIIDLDDLAREQILLAMPSRSLCREDCKGLCPVCGINRNMQACECESTEVDPRWAALKDLRF